MSPSSDRYDFTIHTYGCKVNTYDTGLLQKRFESKGHRAIASDVKATSPSSDEQVDGFGGFGLGIRVPRIHVLNTCAVTAEATREAAKAVRRIKSKDPFSTVVVTGCGAQVDGAVFDELPGADLVVANSHKGSLESLLDQHFKGELQTKVFRSNIFRKDDLEAGGGVEMGHTRAFLKIQDGCNSFCTYCVIPFARGKSRSIPARDLARRVRELHEQGAAEVVLTGVHIGDYEDERAGVKLGLAGLVTEILETTKIPRIRLSSLEPVELTPEVLALYRNDRMCPHFHMSIQSANTRVLSAMRRHYDAEAVETALNAISEQIPGAFVGMDVIAGFPGETDDEFADTYERLARLPWTRIHVFPYSERPGTKAVALEGSVPREVRMLRSQRLRALSSERLAEMARAQIGSIKKVLLLKSGVDGLSRDYWPVRLDVGVLSSDELHRLVSHVGTEVEVTITSFDESDSSRMDGVLIGRLASAQVLHD
ncbi:MAG: tRNA (N(6)-L-threonylcarbamoyladenosine(37)-C(2))-methylthiotransferase MtaB [Bdellovibrionota bacterium]